MAMEVSANILTMRSRTARQEIPSAVRSVIFPAKVYADPVG